MSNADPRIIVVDHQPSQRTVPHADNDPRNEIRQLEWLARLMDSVFEIPGTKIRFGLDSLIGLIPALGDTASSIVSLYILQAASQQGVSRLTMTRMAANVALDYVVGAVPLLGDVFDVYWKANQRNIELLKAHTSTSSSVRRSQQRNDRLFLLALAVALVLILVGSLAVAYFLVSWMVALIATAMK